MNSPGSWATNLGISPGVVVWFTGLPGAGKTTLARAVARSLTQSGHAVEHLDGDELRLHLSSDLGFSAADRNTNVMRAAWVASRIARVGAHVVVSLVSPSREGRLMARELVLRDAQFVEVYVATPVSVCIERDPKGLYRRALAGELTGFTGVDAPYEEPDTPDLRINTSKQSVELACANVLRHLALPGRDDQRGSDAVPRAPGSLTREATIDSTQPRPDPVCG